MNGALSLVAAYVGIFGVGLLIAQVVGAPARRGRVEVAALALPLGSAAVSLLAFWISLAGVRAAFALTSALIAAATLAAAVLTLRPHTRASREAVGRREAMGVHDPRPRLRQEPPARWLLASVLAAIALLTLVTLLTGFAWDGLFIWGVKARIFALAGRVPAAYFADLSRQWSHLDYPLALPLTEAWIYHVTGGVRQLEVRPLFVAYLLALAILLYAAGRRRLDRWRALAVVAALTFTPLLLGLTAWGFADLPLAVAVLASAGAVLIWLETGARSELLLAGLLAATAAWTKREGMVFWAIACATVALQPRTRAGRSRRVLDLLTFALPGVILLPWLIFVAGHGVLGADFAAVSGPTLLQRLWRLPRLAALLGAELLAVRRWGILWVMAAVWLITGRGRRWSGPERWLAGVATLYVVALTTSYLWSVWVPWQEHVTLSLGRIIFQVAPMALLAAGWRGLANQGDPD